MEFELDVHPYGVGVYDEWVFWTDWREHNLQKVNVSSIVDTQELIGGLIQPRDANVFHRHRNRNGQYCLEDSSYARDQRLSGCTYYTYLPYLPVYKSHRYTSCTPRARTLNENKIHGI